MKYYKQDKKNGEIIEVSQKWAMAMTKTSYKNPAKVLKGATKENPLKEMCIFI